MNYWSHLEIIIGGEYNDDLLFLGFNSLFDLLCLISGISTIFVIAAICCCCFVFLKRSSTMITHPEVYIKSCDSAAKRAEAFR